MKDPTLKPITERIASLYEGTLNPPDTIEVARNLTGFVGLLLEIAKETEVELGEDAV